MSGLAREACSLRRNLSHIVHITTLGTVMHPITCLSRFSKIQQRWSHWKVHCSNQSALLERLGLKLLNWEDKASILPKSTSFTFNHLRSTSSGFHGGQHGFPSFRALQTVAPVVEKPLSKEIVVVGVDPKAGELLAIQQAMMEYLELTLKVPHELAFNISHKSPAFLNGLVEKLRQESSPSESNLNALVKNHLSVSKFKGVEPLLETLGVHAHDIVRVSEYARSGVKGVLVKVDLLKIIGVKAEEVPKILTKYPRFLSNALATHQLKVEYLAQLGMSPLEICKLITSYPNSLSFGLRDGDLPLVIFLRNLGVKDDDLKKVLARCPQLLTLNVERKLQPAIDTLASVGITGHYLTRVLIVQPSLLRRRLERNIAFCREVGLDAKPGVIARLLVTCPNFSVNGGTARINYLKSVGLTEEQILLMITKNPAFLSLNVETALAPKVEYILKVMGRPVEQLVTAATFLTMSLEHRIKPRHEVLAALDEAGLLRRSYSLNTIVTWSDEYFSRKFVEKSPMRIRRLWVNSSKGTRQ